MGVGAGLEVDVECASFRALPGLSKRLFLGMRVTGPLVIALAGEVTLAIEHDGTDHRVRAGAVVRLGRQREGARRPMQVGAAAAPRGVRLSCHCNNRIRSMRFYSLHYSTGYNFCSFTIAPL